MAICIISMVLIAIHVLIYFWLYTYYFDHQTECYEIQFASRLLITVWSSLPFTESFYISLIYISIYLLVRTERTVVTKTLQPPFSSCTASKSQHTSAGDQCRLQTPLS